MKLYTFRQWYKNGYVKDCYTIAHTEKGALKLARRFDTYAKHEYFIRHITAIKRAAIKGEEDGYDINYLHGICPFCKARLLSQCKRVLCECGALLRWENKKTYCETDVLINQYMALN